jgi:cobaltochelatase CobS
MASENDKITCAICGAKIHAVPLHLKSDHPEMTLSEYRETYPGEPLLSPFAQKKVEENAAKKAGAAIPTKEVERPAAVEPPPLNLLETLPPAAIVKRPLHEVFGLSATCKDAMSAKGAPIPIQTLSPHDHQNMVPDVFEGYVYDVDELKNVVLALELNIPTYVWGHKGSGKSELMEQVCARTNRPMVRLQHTVNTEESHILGQWTARAGETVFEYGPLPHAMIHGYAYLADEYDFALPSVLAVYQPVLERKALYIKEAPEHMRHVKPHPNFRFMATGNTNGSGDETGLYQGTVLQNSANYDRFGMVINKKYMEKTDESKILQNHLGLKSVDADKMVEFAALVREAYDGAKIGDTISPRALLYAATIGLKRASFSQGITLAFTNKLSKVDREVVAGLAKRVFG